MSAHEARTNGHMTATDTASHHAESVDCGNSIQKTSQQDKYEATNCAKQAVHWYTIAAQQGHEKAAYNLACCYAKGIGVEQNVTTALHWYRQAAKCGNTNAISILVRWYEAGVRGVGIGGSDDIPKDPAEAQKWRDIADQRSD